ncbi:hypothetical protein PSTG_17259 [Puccinia striiformis f. sp. tritici PST-78]|uniref:HAT C-terminal dimerisation domain-containing protein n=1 Tax=Puccinia striiformis f. sp. tritici PST-78 TaxID=1165861 RepID=A0A0L0UQH1_9BASI|nr:hypothetical protein PSTG_17259 [Puccinia striiformis f. sp. tritici PST-78]
MMKNDYTNGYWPITLTWQKDQKYGLDCKHHINRMDIQLARDLVAILELFYEQTLQETATNTHLSSKMHADLVSMLHPSFKDKYFKIAGWEADWITEALRLTREMFTTFYKPEIEILPSSQLNKSNKLALAAQPGLSANDPLNTWLASGLILDDGSPVNALKWWIRQKRAGNTHGGLLRMALDVLSCPATSVDVERAFSFGRDYVSEKRHRLSGVSISRGLSVAFYSKNGLIEPGVLRKWKEKIQVEKKQSSKAKGKKKQ